MSPSWMVYNIWPAERKKSLRGLTAGDTPKENYFTYLHDKKSDHTKHKVEQFVYDLKVLRKW